MLETARSPTDHLSIFFPVLAIQPKTRAFRGGALKITSRELNFDSLPLYDNAA